MKSIDRWAYLDGAELDFSRPGKPTDNSFIEAFNGRFRQECLDENWFLSAEDAAGKVGILAKTLQWGEAPHHFGRPVAQGVCGTGRNSESTRKTRTKPGTEGVARPTTPLTCLQAEM